MGRIDSGRGYDTELGFERRQYHLAHEGRYAPGIFNTRIYRNGNENTGRLIAAAAVPPDSHGWTRTASWKARPTSSTARLPFDEKSLTGWAGQAFLSEKGGPFPVGRLPAQAAAGWAARFRRT